MVKRMKNSSFIFLQPEYPELFTLTEHAIPERCGSNGVCDEA